MISSSVPNRQKLYTLSDMNMDDLWNEIRQVAPTRGLARAAVATWAGVRLDGIEKTKQRMSRSTWYRHLSILEKAGITKFDIEQADMHRRKVVPFRQKMIVLGDPVTSWEDLKRRCATK